MRLIRQRLFQTVLAFVGAIEVIDRGDYSASAAVLRTRRSQIFCGSRRVHFSFRRCLMVGCYLWPALIGRH